MFFQLVALSDPTEPVTVTDHPIELWVWGAIVILSPLLLFAWNKFTGRR